MTLLVRNRERWFRWALAQRHGKQTPGFFDDYPRFFSTSTTAATRDRLNQRYLALIESNQDILKGKYVLDIASHDGRWSFAARKAGATSVIGIEAREHLVKAARENMREYGITGVKFIPADVFEELDSLHEPPDTVLCFGFFYHTLEHMSLLKKITRLKPSHLIIDTAISLRPGSLIEVEPEFPKEESAGRFEQVKGTPTKQALELMLSVSGFANLSYYNWQDAGITDWRELKDYYLGKRITLRASL